MKKIFLCSLVSIFFFGSGVFAADGLTASQRRATRIINVEMHKAGNQFAVTKALEVIFGDFVYGTDINDYKGIVSNGTVVSFQGTTLGYFEIPSGRINPMLCVDSFGAKNTGGCNKIDNVDVTIQIPYFPNGKSVDVYSENKEKLFSIDISSVATCNENGKCDSPKETIQECPLDCVEEKKIETPVPVTPEAPKTPWKWIIIGSLLAITIAGVAFAVYRRRQEY